MTGPQRAEVESDVGRHFEDHADITHSDNESQFIPIEKHCAQNDLMQESSNYTENSKKILWSSSEGSNDSTLTVATAAPREYSIWKKRLILLVITYAGSIGPTGNTLYLPGLPQIQSDLNTSYTAVNASLAETNLATAIFPLFWAASSDIYGRKAPFLVALAIATISNVCGALSVDAGMLIAFRDLSGAGVSAYGYLCWNHYTYYDDKQQGSAFTTFTMGPFLGTCIGPIIGGRLAETFGWRSILYFMTVYALSAWILILLCVPETSKIRNNFTASSEKHPIEDGRYPRRSIGIRDVKLLGALKFYSFPNVFPICLVSGLSYFAFYFNNTAFIWIYIEQYDLSPCDFSLSYLVFPVGCVVGSLLGGRLSDRAYKHKVTAAERSGREPNFEMRLGVIMLGISFIVWVACLSAFGWCVQENVHFAFGIVCEFVVNTCYSAASVITATYLINSFEDHSSSVNACNTFARYSLAAVGELFASDMLAAVPAGPLYMAIGFLLFMSSLSIIYIKRNSRKWKRCGRNVSFLST